MNEKNDDQINLDNKPKETVGVNEALALSRQEDNGEKVSTIRTFQSDIAGAVKTDNVSMIKIALAEKEKREKDAQYLEIGEKNKLSKSYLYAGVFIFFLATALGGAYWYFNRPLPPTLEELIAPNEPEIIYTETQSQVSIENKSPDRVFEDLRKETLAKLDLGTMKRILITTSYSTSTKNLTSTEFLTAIRARANDSFRSSIEPYFVIGAYSFEPHDVFIIFKVNSYDVAYPGMLAWERELEFDLSDLFMDKSAINTNNTEINTTSSIETPTSQNLDTEKSTTTVSTSTTQSSTTISEIDINTQPSNQNPIATTENTRGVWKDRIVQNKDARVLIDSTGNIKFMYSFIDKNTLVIVSSEKGFKEIISRMTTGRIRR